MPSASGRQLLLQRFLVQALRDHDWELAVRPPLIVHGESPGGYSTEVAALIDPPLAQRAPLPPD